MNITEMSGLEIGKLVKKKEISATEVVTQFLDKIDAENSTINAFVYTKREEALEAAKAIDIRIASNDYVGPLAGVPVGLKDFLPSKKGWTSSHGGVKALMQVDSYDSEFYKATKSLGAIAIGKTNAPAFGFRGVTDNNMYGPTSTPFRPGYNSGGSSGGSCAAVSAGFAPLAEVGDAGGSGRIPAAWCGCVGYKPSAGIVPSVCRPDAWTATHPYCCGGPAGRTVDDVAVVMSKMTYYDYRDPLSVKLRDDVFTVVKERRTPRFKIAFTTNFDLFPQPEAEIVEAIKRTANKLAYMGCEIDDVKFDFHYSLREYEEAWLRGICIDTAIDMELDKQRGFDLIKQAKDDLPEDFIEWNDIALKSTMLDYRKFHEIRTDILDAHCNIFDNYDLIIAPVAGCMPVPNRPDGKLTLGPSKINGQKVDPLIGFAYTYLENMIGTPAMSVPIGLSREGLPIGLQIIGPRYRDLDVFALAYAIEKIQPWYDSYSKISLK